MYFSTILVILAFTKLNQTSNLMKKVIQISCLFCGILLAISCNDSAKSTNAAPDFDAMAQDLCKCMMPLMEIQEKIRELSVAGETGKIQELLSDVEKMSAESETCVGKLDEKYGEVQNEDEAKANAAFQKACPKVAAMLNDVVE